jgi:hypothetical protein
MTQLSHLLGEFILVKCISQPGCIPDVAAPVWSLVSYVQELSSDELYNMRPTKERNRGIIHLPHANLSIPF